MMRRRRTAFGSTDRQLRHMRHLPIASFELPEYLFSASSSPAATTPATFFPPLVGSGGSASAAEHQQCIAELDKAERGGEAEEGRRRRRGYTKSTRQSMTATDNSSCGKRRRISGSEGGSRALVGVPTPCKDMTTHTFSERTTDEELEIVQNRPKAVGKWAHKR